jgi:hypothetical protein
MRRISATELARNLSRVLDRLAIQHGFKFLTRNGKDFEDIPGLELRTYKLPA